jgi:fructose-1,6-bisphosphatase/inositol monophosphatase family enzyme
MLVSMRQAGAAARLMQGRVANEGKDDGTSFPNDDAALRSRRAAKTLADEVVQEILLLAASEFLEVASTGLDAEEITPSTALFSKTPTSRQTLVVDPIDGTIEYCEGKTSYSVCVGLERGGEVVVALVYFPARDIMYRYVAGERPVVVEQVSTDPQKCPLRRSPSASGPPVIYKNGRVPLETVAALEKAGFRVRDDTDDQIGAPDAILACLRGEAVAYISHTRQMRDILLGAVIGGLPTGGAYDWHGTRLTWPRGGRVPRAVFMADDSLQHRLWPCLGTGTNA